MNFKCGWLFVAFGDNMYCIILFDRDTTDNVAQLF